MDIVSGIKNHNREEEEKEKREKLRGGRFAFNKNAVVASEFKEKNMKNNMDNRSRMDNRMEKKVDNRMEKKVDNRVEKKVDNRVEKKVDNRMESRVEKSRFLGNGCLPS